MTQQVLPARAFAFDPRTGQLTRRGYELLDQLRKHPFAGDLTASEARTTLGLATTDDVTFNSVTTTADVDVGGDVNVTGDVGGATGTFTGLLTLASRIKTDSTTINDDDFHLFDFGENIFAGFLFVATNNASRTGEIYWVRAASSPSLAPKLANANFQNTTGALTGTTGADGVTTVSCDSDGRFWVENREGFALVYSLFFVGL